MVYFSQLSTDDLCALIKGCVMEVICLRAAYHYDPDSKTVLMPNGAVLTIDSLGEGGRNLFLGPFFRLVLKQYFYRNKLSNN